MKHAHAKSRLLFVLAYVHGFVGASDYVKSGPLTAFFFIAAFTFFGFGLFRHLEEAKEDKS